jgi:hypothetical protein
MSRAGKGTAASSDAGNATPLPWTGATRRMAKGGWYLLASVRPDTG